MGDRLSPRPRRAAALIAVAAIALDSALLGLISPLLPEIRDRTGVGEAGLGLALAAYSIPILFVALPLGRASDRLGRRPLLLLGLVFCAIGSILIAASTSLAPLLLGRAVQGIGSTASWIAALALVSDLAPEGRRGEAIGFALAANSAGAIAGPTFGGVTGDAFSFAIPFLAVAAIALFLLLLGWFLLPRDPGIQPEPGGAGLGEILRRPGVIAVVTIGSGAAALLAMFEVVVPLDLDARLGAGAATLGVLFGAAIAIDAVAAPFSGRAGDRIGRGPVAAAGMVAIAAAAVLLPLVHTYAGVAVAMALFGAGTGVTFAAAVPWLDEAFGTADRGLAYGSLSLLYSAGYALGPLLAGGILQLSGSVAAYAAIGVIALAAAATALRVRGAVGHG